MRIAVASHAPPSSDDDVMLAAFLAGLDITASAADTCNMLKSSTGAKAQMHIPTGEFD